MWCGSNTPLMDRRRIARERIDRLFSEAEDAYTESPERAHRYVEKAREISMRARVRIPRRHRRRMCGSCHSYLRFGDNARVRLQGDRVTVTCLECGTQTRYPY